MLKLITFCLLLGALSTCLASPTLWYHVIIRHTIWGDEENNGINKNMPFIRGHLTFLLGTTFITFVFYYFLSADISFFCLGSLAAFVCIGLCHIWASAFYIRLNEKIFIAKVAMFFLTLIIYIILFFINN